MPKDIPKQIPTPIPAMLFNERIKTTLQSIAAMTPIVIPMIILLFFISVTPLNYYFRTEKLELLIRNML